VPAGRGSSYLEVIRDKKEKKRKEKKNKKNKNRDREKNYPVRSTCHPF
jgi:hypothetical protein